MMTIPLPDVTLPKRGVVYSIYAQYMRAKEGYVDFFVFIGTID
jgi:hypothetical protein